MAEPQSHYNIDDFIKACKDKPGTIEVWPKVVSEASRFFQLSTKRDIIEYIANDGLEQLCFLNSQPFPKEGTAVKKTIVDAYEFRINNKGGYLAFMKKIEGDGWVIKSFHLSNRERIGDVRNDRRFLDSLRDIGWSRKDLP